MATKNPQDTPMMQQYRQFRAQLPKNALLLFRLGDFYELFNKDAEDASQILGLTLTQRHGIPMAGLPYHAAEAYINKLLKAGKKVGICEQAEVAKAGKLVKRELKRILTPGTTLEDSQVTANESHYILALSLHKTTLHAAWLDLTTGAFAIASDPRPENLLPVFNALSPKEVLVPEIAYKAWQSKDGLDAWYEQFSYFTQGRPLTEVQDYHFDSVAGAKAVMESMGVMNLEGFGVKREHPGLGPAAALITYATETLCSPPKNIRSLKEYRSSDNLLLDPSTLRNLEIFKNSTHNSRDGTLIEAMDRTVTAAGARLLEEYLASPLLDLVEINRRQQCVADMLENPGLGLEIQEKLRKVRDISRIVSRLQNRIRNPRELGGIRDTLNQLPFIKEQLTEFDGVAVRGLWNRIDTLDDLNKLLSDALMESLPAKPQDGGVIKDGFNEELDRYRSLSRDSKQWLAELEETEQANTGIKNLKIKFNGSFGYFIEVTKTNLHLVPDHYIRKQTMTNAERFYTEDLKEKEKEILSAEDKALAIEERLFLDLVVAVLDYTDILLGNARVLAEIDLFLGWTLLTLEWNYSRPSLDETRVLNIKGGRHPVVEQMLRRNSYGPAAAHNFVPNDTYLKSDDDQMALITGPNMAGKSTYIRQVALITLMAQIGSYVPAAECHVGLVDRIFSRVGASDELARGNSTFMVEMNETANILNNATDSSLIILDEIGRGTSTYDGLSIAWAVVEHLHSEEALGPRTLFATHYHELTQLDKTLPRLRNFSVAVKEHDDNIVFVRRVVPGAADRSYGIQVARLAGLPGTVISRAKCILEELETEGQVVQEHLFNKKPRKKAKSSKEEPNKTVPQMTLF